MIAGQPREKPLGFAHRIVTQKEPLVVEKLPQCSCGHWARYVTTVTIGVRALGQYDMELCAHCARLYLQVENKPASALRPIVPAPMKRRVQLSDRCKRGRRGIVHAVTAKGGITHCGIRLTRDGTSRCDRPAQTTGAPVTCRICRVATGEEV